MKPKVSAKISPLRNDSWTAGQPGRVDDEPGLMTARNRTVLVSAIFFDLSARRFGTTRTARRTAGTTFSPGVERAAAKSDHAPVWRVRTRRLPNFVLGPEAGAFALSASQLLGDLTPACRRPFERG